MIEGNRLRCSNDTDVNPGWVCWDSDGNVVEGDDVDIKAGLVQSKGPIRSEKLAIDTQESWMDYFDITFEGVGKCERKNINGYRPISCRSTD